MGEKKEQHSVLWLDAANILRYQGILGNKLVGDGHSAQVFKVRVLNPKCNTETFQGTEDLVAKVYDPLYLNDHDGDLIPRFYGSYSTDINCQDIGDDAETNEMCSRTVRLILNEHVPGRSMLQAGPSNFPQRDRQQIMKSVIEFESEVYRRDILLTDLSPRNVMMVPPGSRRQCNLEFFLGQYISPILRWKKGMKLEFDDWIDWEWADWVDAEFAYTAHTITPAMRERYSKK
ncbi:hypothetical protein BO79DRAFT_229668 [Aspergillus costaricaensis CBS 115574]|uniref:Uncharacterized protein n=1 Tax=Aspergillus costaricaensis CBS 115574 TaxID=1448317 RepID=A0ACD1IAJ1_9EURO|nr:hypothetical protein BO79DRAFT_229668 [Aspergillus costaricaensis CBS 115574]RAK87304.1 hypothetical protein BO79DRAFT_229668 [Aspergillus costaricaensis CBS 115574]